MHFKYLFLLCLPLSLFALPGFVEPWGVDADLIPQVKQTEEIMAKPSLAARMAEKVIWLRQNVLTHVDGPRSHFRPTSSEYMRLAIRKYGFIQGYLMGCDRLMRENSDEWVYKTIESDGKLFKYDPP